MYAGFWNDSATSYLALRSTGGVVLAGGVAFFDEAQRQGVLISQKDKRQAARGNARGDFTNDFSRREISAVVRGGNVGERGTQVFEAAGRRNDSFEEKLDGIARLFLGTSKLDESVTRVQKHSPIVCQVRRRSNETIEQRGDTRGRGISRWQAAVSRRNVGECGAAAGHDGPGLNVWDSVGAWTFETNAM